MPEKKVEVYDAIIIGSGQAGNPLAERLASEGWKTALIERNEVGGSCINYGCTPSKTLEASAREAYLVNKSKEFGLQSSVAKVKMTQIYQRKKNTVEQFRKGTLKGLKDSKVKLIKGEASFADKKTIEVRTGKNRRRLKAEKIFIDTGTSPLIPPIEGLEKVPYLDSTSIMELKQIPKHLLIIGGGYIGLEFGQMFKRFGSEITIIEKTNHLLPREDEDVAEEIQNIFKQDGIKFLLNSEVHKISKHGRNISLKVKSGKSNKIIEGSHLLVAVGIKPNTEALNLDAAGIKRDEKGFINVNAKLETNIRGIYALGDVKGGPAFTHISYDDFRIVRDNLLEKKNVTIRKRIAPYAVFIDPQLGRAGLSESDARKQNSNIAVAKMAFNHVSRGIEVNETRGFLKAVVDKKTEKILGCSVLGYQGSEISAMIQIAMMGKLKYTDLKNAIFVHPTLSEALNNLFGQIK